MMISSTMPSQKYSCSVSPDMFWNGRAAIHDLSRKAGGVEPVGVVAIRHPLVFGRLPGVAGYTAYLAPAISRRDEEGFSSCSACPCHRAVASTPPRLSSRIGQISATHAAFALTVAGSAFGSLHFRGHIHVHLHYGPMTRTSPKQTPVDTL